MDKLITLPLAHVCGVKTQGSRRGLNPGSPALAAGALTTPQPPEHFHSSFKGDRQPYTQTDAREVCQDN